MVLLPDASNNGLRTFKFGRASVDLLAHGTPRHGTVESTNGQFRIRPATGENAAHGGLVFELKQRYKDDDWQVGYVFDSRQPNHDGRM